MQPETARGRGDDFQVFPRVRIARSCWALKRTAIMYRILVLTMAATCLWACTSRPGTAPTSACTTLSKLIDTQSGGPAFLPSYPTAQTSALKGTAFLYDNSLATIALVACGEREKASRIGDAILVALNHDRYWHDGRLRNAYLAGPVGAGEVKLPGWFDARLNRWSEDAYQVGSDNGNIAWTILALLSLDRPGHDRRYRDAAVRIGAWITRWHSSLGAGGFTGGTFDEEPVPKIQSWKSTEQNSDLAGAFTVLAEATGDKTWLQQAQSAKQFVHAMWDVNCKCFDAGTEEDGTTRNRFVALDAQIFPLLALPGAAIHYAAAITTANTRLRDGPGFSYGEARGGMWTEGTEQAALFMELSARKTEARNLIRVAQTMRTPDGNYYAASTTQLPTGLKLDTDPSQSRRYFRLAHLAPLSWAAIVERRYNPFTHKSTLP